MINKIWENSSPAFTTMIICYNNTWVRQDAFYYFQAEGNTHKNTEVLLSGFFQQSIERSHMDKIIQKRLQITPFPPPPHSPSFDQHVSKCYNDSIVEGTLLWNSAMQFYTLGGSLAIACILFWTTSVNLSWGKTSVTNPQSLASTAVSLRPASNISLD